ncbi:MAG: TolC family protein [Acidobacteriaceae bacterium]
MRKQVWYWLAMGACALLGASSAAAQISLASTVDLALQNSPKVRMGEADVKRADAGLSEIRDAWVPNFVVGSGVGYTYGFPVGQPSIFNVSSQSLLFSFSQPSYVRAARAALKSAQLSLKDTQDQVTLDCAMAYIQLDTDTRELSALDEEKAAAERLVSIEHQRLIAGVASRMDETKARITSAQVDLKHLHLEDDVAAQRQKLAHWTGLPASSFIPQSKSIPPAPELSGDSALNDEALIGNAGIQAALANAKSKRELSSGDAKQNYRPQFGFGIEYNRYAEFNNYQEYYKRFQHNNFDLGVQITFPLFDAGRRAKARESAAAAVHAGAQADQAKNQASEQVETLQHNLLELKAQQRFAELQSQLAQEQLETVQSELKNGSGLPNAAPVSPRDEELAKIQAEERYQDALNAGLSLKRAQLSLLRAVGSIESWAHLPAQ